MARNGSGTMSVTNTFSSGTTISSSAMNSNFSDVASEITNSLPRDGQASMTAQFKAAAGTVATPGISFGSDTNTGLYSKSGDVMGVVAGGTEVATISSSGITDANSLLLVGIPTGVMMMYGATTAPTGWVRCNARTIGDASSAATERANADTSSLFTFLWTNYSDTVCPVSSGRGASAAADYAAHKTISLPDMRGRAVAGLDDMGSTAAGRLGTILTSSTTNGATGGTETHTLTQAQLPSYNLTVTDPNHVHGKEIPSNKTTYNINGLGGTPVTNVWNGVSVDNTSSAPTGITVASGGSGSAHSNLQPTFLTTFIIKL